MSTVIKENAKVNIIESSFTESKDFNIDEEAGVIRNVKIIGKQSRNNRVYSDKALVAAKELYEGVTVNLDHPDRETPYKERGVMEGIGWLEGVNFKDDGLWGDFHYYKNHPYAQTMVERARRNPKGFGLSHNAEGRMDRRDKVVEVIEAVRSVDLVGRPATTEGLFESEEGKPTPMKTTLRKLVESNGSTAQKTNLSEFFEQENPEESVASILEMEIEVVEPREEGEFPALLNESLAKVSVALMGEGEIEQKQERMKSLAVAESVIRNGLPKPAPEPPKDKDEEIARLKAQLESYEAREKARTLLEAEGIVPKGYQISAVASLQSAAEKSQLIESFKGNSESPSGQGASPPKEKPEGAEDLRERLKTVY